MDIAPPLRACWKVACLGRDSAASRSLVSCPSRTRSGPHRASSVVSFSSHDGAHDDGLCDLLPPYAGHWLRRLAAGGLRQGGDILEQRSVCLCQGTARQGAVSPTRSRPVRTPTPNKGK